MYEPFFEMQRRPFSATPDPGCFFACESVQAALDELVVCVERGQGIGILVAPAGMGKSLLCQRLVGETGQQFEVVYLGNSSFPTRRSLLQAILFEMGDEYSRKDESELRIDLRSRLLSIRPAREALVLIIDEAHLFVDELLEEIRTLADIAHDGTPLVRVILSAQPELEERLTSRSFDAINQRISNQIYLESLSLSESRQYLEHRLVWADTSLDSVFTPESVDVITRASDGVPRCLNQLADHSLLLAFASDERPVQRQTVCDALDDLKQLPLHWNDVSTGETVVGWQGDDEEEEEPEMPETDIVVQEELGDPAFETNQSASDSQTAHDASEHPASPSTESDHSFDEASPSFDEADPWSLPAVAASPSAVIEFGEPTPAVETSSFETDSQTAVDQAVASEQATSGEQTVREEVVSVEEAWTEVVLDETPQIDEVPQLDEPAASDDVHQIEAAQSHDRADAAEDSSAGFAGLCFAITADGCQYEGGYVAPVDASAVQDQAAVTDMSDDSSSDTPLEDSNAYRHELVDAESDATAAENTDAGIGELDDVTDGSDVSDVNGSESAAPAFLEFGHEESAPETTASEPDSAGHDDTEDDSLVHDSTAVVEAAVAQAAVVEAVGEEEEAGEVQEVAEFEEEVIIDHYSALAEPQSTGIIWNLVGSRRLEVAPASNQPDVTADNGDTDSADAETVIAEPVSDAEESADTHHEPDVVSDSESDSANIPIESVEDGSFEFDFHADQTGVFDAAGETTEAAIEDTATEEQAEEAIEPGLVMVDAFSTDLEGDASAEQEAGADAGDVESEAAPEEEHTPENGVAAWHDDVLSVRPDSRIDALVPLLDELSGGSGNSEQSAAPQRSMLDIEAELVQKVEFGQPQIEDEIGAAILEMCLDTQSQLRDARDSIESAEPDDGIEGFDALVVDGLARYDNEARFDVSPSDDSPFGDDPYDIVQPDEDVRTAAYRFDTGSSHGNEESGSPIESSTSSPQPRPFGRLFSELRRRQRPVG